MDPTATLALAGGAAWASGINVYAAILMLGVLGATGSMTLPPDLEILADPMVMLAASFMYCVEFFADKTPGVDTGWDALHTFIRVPAGAVLAASAVGELEPTVQLAALIIGGGLAATTHATKAGTRAIINTSPEPVTNWTASITEDLLVFAGLWTALNHPYVFGVLLALFLLLIAWLLPKIFRALKMIAARVRRFFGGAEDQDANSGETETASLPSLNN
ncbi:MAG: DUF4126 domain-containing protein [Pseudomonadota bacterium]